MSSGMAFAIPGRWTGGKREEDEMRRLMAQEVEAAKARGEILEETSASDFSSNEEENNKDTSGPASSSAIVAGTAPIQSNKQDNATTDILEMNNDILDDIVADQNKVDHVVQTKSGSTSRRPRDDTGNDADMDDTSMSSRASSRMLESINVISMDSMNVM